MASRHRRSPWRTAMHILLTLMLLGILLFGLALGTLCYAEAHPPVLSGDSQAIIVLGCQVYRDGTPSPQLELRLEAALEAWRQHPRMIIACGAQGSNEPAPEGDVMRAWLLDKGVPADQVIAETASTNTRQNLLNAKALLPEGILRVTVVTSDYHLPRALAVASDVGLTADGIGSPCKPEYWAKNHFREILAWGKYLLNQAVSGQ